MSYVPPHDSHANHDDDAPWRTPRHDGWTVARQQEFLEELAAHGNVAHAAAAVGMSASSAYRLRGREMAAGGGAFSAGWRAARGMAYERLTDIAFERIANGVPVVHFYKGELAGTKYVYSDRLLLGMLRHLRDDGTAARPAARPTVAHPTIARPVAAADPGDAYAAALDAFAVALETDTAPVMPPAAADDVAPHTGPATGPADDPAGAPPRPSPGEGAYHEARVAAAQARLARGDDPFVPRLAGRIYPPRPDAFWLEIYPDGLTADDLAAEDAHELALVGLTRGVTRDGVMGGGAAGGIGTGGGVMDGGVMGGGVTGEGGENGVAGVNFV